MQALRFLFPPTVPHGGSVSPIFMVERGRLNVNANASMTATSIATSACGGFCPSFAQRIMEITKSQTFRYRDTHMFDTCWQRGRREGAELAPSRYPAILIISQYPNIMGPRSVADYLLVSFLIRILTKIHAFLKSWSSHRQLFNSNRRRMHFRNLY